MADSTGAGSTPDSTRLIELPATLSLGASVGHADLLAALREAAAAYVDLRGEPATIADALADVDRPCLATALIAAEADLKLPDGWVPLSERLTAAGGLALGIARQLQAIRLARPVPGERSAYRGAGGAMLAIGIAVRASFSEQGSIAGVQVALGGVSPAPLRARQVEAALRGRRPSEQLIALAVQTAAHEAQPAGIGSLTAPGDLETVQAISRDALQAVLL